MNKQGKKPSGYKKKETPEAREELRVFRSGRGGYLLSRFRSIIDEVRFNFSVRNGKRWSPHAMATLIRLLRADAGSGDLYKSFT